MKVTSIVVGLCAALATAAPTELVSRKNKHDVSSLNNLNKFNSQDIQYVNNLNNLDLNLFNELSEVNNFNIFSFESLFQSNSFDLESLLQLAQVQTLLQFANEGLFNGIDLSSFNLNSVNLGLVQNVGSVDLSQFIQQSVVPQVQVIAAQTGTSSRKLRRRRQTRC
jgi:ABC-type oligopeptide transport system substrate-binding subunit